MSDETEQQLAAWLDGALDPAAAAGFEARLASDPALAARAAEWKANDLLITGAFAPLAAAAPDAALLARLDLDEAAPLRPPAAANDNPPWWRGRGLAIGGTALAAGLAVALVVSGQLSGSRPDPLSLALDTTPSLHTALLADGRRIEPTLTVRAADGRWCREYHSGAEVALACRSAAGWQLIQSAKAGERPAGQDEVGLAGGADSALLDPAYARINASDPIDAQREAQLIAQKWQQR